MATFTLSDGFGNQLFQYAAAIHFAKATGADIAYDTSYYTSVKARSDRPLLIEQLLGVELPKSHSPLPRLLAKLHGTVGTTQLGRWSYASREPGADFDPATLSPHAFIRGYFQSEDFFRPSRDRIVATLTKALGAVPTITHTHLHSQKPTTAVHIRRGDYTSIHGLAISLNRIRAATARVHDTNFLLFSDDIETIAKEDFGVDMHPVRTGSVLEQLRTMSTCDNFIIANSTYSWWASYLAPQPGKTVLAPRDWYGAGQKPQRHSIYLPSHEFY